MTPERAREWAHNLPPNPHWSEIRAVILAACAEERKAALTEAASACIDERCVNVKDDIEELAYNEACADCEAAVLRLRDREPR